MIGRAEVPSSTSLSSRQHSALRPQPPTSTHSNDSRWIESGLHTLRTASQSQSVSISSVNTSLWSQTTRGDGSATRRGQIASTPPSSMVSKVVEIINQRPGLADAR